MSHWTEFLIVDNYKNIDDIAQLLSDNNLLTKEDAENLYSDYDYDRISDTLYKNYFEKYEDEYTNEFENNNDAMKFIEETIIPRMKQDKTEAAIKKLEAQKEEIQKKIDALKGDFDTKPVEKIDFKLPVRAQDDSSLDIEKSRNEGYKYAKIFIPPLPPPPPPQSELKNDLQELFDIKDDFKDKVPTGKYASINDVKNAWRYKKIDSFMEKLYDKPFGTTIPIKDFDDEELEYLAPLLYKWFCVKIKNHLNDKMLIQYHIGSKNPKHTVQKELDRIEKMFKDNVFFDINEQKPDINAYDSEIYLNIFDGITFFDYSQWVPKPNSRRSVHGDGFFPRKLSGNYKKLEEILYPFQIYSTYLDEKDKVKKNVNTPCFINALLESGVDKKICDEILAFVGYQARINRNVWTELASNFNLAIHLRIYDHKRGKIDIGNKENKGWYNPNGETKIYLAEYLDHVFVDKELPINLFAIRNWDNVCEKESNTERALKTYKFRPNGSINIDNKKANFYEMNDSQTNSSDDDVIEDMNIMLEVNPIKKEKLRKISRTNTYANSVNVYVGRPRSGKTYLALHDIISVVRADPCVHLLVYINESGTCDDDTFDRFQQLITVPIIYVKYDQCEKYLKQLLEYKNIYNKIKSSNMHTSERGKYSGPVLWPSDMAHLLSCF